MTLGLAEIRRSRPIPAEMRKKGKNLMAGAMYDLTTGMVRFIS
jgi:hypothetical protein